MKRTGIKNREINENKGVPSISKTTVLFILLIILGIIGIILVIFYVSDSTSMTLNENTYQYFYDTPIDYSKGSTISSEYMEIIENEERKYIDYTPFYSYDSKTIYLPRNYGWVNVDDNSFFRIPEFSSIFYGQDLFYHCSSNEANYIISNGFLYDGYDSYNYIFLEKGKIMIDSNSYDVSPLSFYSKTYDQARIYDYINNKFTLVDDDFSSSKYISSSGYEIDLGRGIYKSSQGEKMLLPSSPSSLESIEERSK